MLLSIFSNPITTHLLEIFFWMLGAFLIGLYFGRYFITNEKNNISIPLTKLEEINMKDDISKIRATKTFERGGKEMAKTVPIDFHDRGLNFDRIGKATIFDKDNLKEINGIGKSIETRLHNINIFTFQQLSNFNSKDITKVTELIRFFPGRIERDDWVGQAFKLLEESNT